MRVQVLFVGIIDTLVPFEWRKRAEYALKSLLQVRSEQRESRRRGAQAC